MIGITDKVNLVSDVRFGHRLEFYGIFQFEDVDEGFEVGSVGVALNEEVVYPCCESERRTIVMKEESRGVATHAVSMGFKVFHQIHLRDSSGIIHAVNGVVDFK